MRKRFINQVFPITLLFCQFSVAASVEAINFALVNESSNTRCEVARVSLPMPRGAAPLVPANWLTVDGKPKHAQARVVTSYPDGSPNEQASRWPPLT